MTGLGGGAWAFGLVPGAESCGGAPLDLKVAAQPELAPVLRAAADRFNVEDHRVAGRCVRARVSAVPPAEFARDGSRRRGTDVWVPESSLWLAVARDAGDTSVPLVAPHLAESPVVLATTRPVDAEFTAAHVGTSWRLLLGSKAKGLPISRRVPDPGLGMTGTIAMIAVGQVGGKGAGDEDAVSAALRRAAPPPQAYAAGGSAAVLADLIGTERFDRPLAVTSEQAVVAYNDANEPNPVVSLVPREGTLTLDHPYAVLAREQIRKEAADAFKTALGSRSARDILQQAGFRAPDGTLNATYARKYNLPEKSPSLLRVPTRKEIDRALASWKA